ncbi:MAG: Gldg family protein [Lachnospiraceae bacterium]|nr:Gldg family protein [Lachnospiraceae bacterium]
MIAIYKRELKSYFCSFLGSLFIGVMLFLMGIYFSVYNLFMGYPYIGYALSSIVFLFLIGIPILTMRILAEERHQKTDQLILTAPVSVSSIVLGKFLALATIFAIPVGIISIYPLILSLFGTIAFGETYVAVLGFFLYGIACIAIGVFVSSLTESQVIAAVITFGVLFLGYVMSGICNMISATGNFLTKILSAFDMVGRFDTFLNGSLQMTSVIYYVSAASLFLIFTVQSIQKRRYQISGRNFSMSAYSVAAVIISTASVILLNVLAMELPLRFTSFDVTSNRLYSLTDETKEIISTLEEDIQLYVLANEKQADSTLDATLKKYADLNSHVKVSYVDPAVNPKFFTKYTDSDLSFNSIIAESSKRYKVIDYSNIYQTQVDYTTYSSVVTGYDGEGQLTSAIAYVTSDDMPKIYLLEGHGEAVFDANFTAAIEKENIEYETINLMNYDTVPEDASCVIIYAPSSDFSEDDTEKMLYYMENGGDVFLITGYTENEMTNFQKLLAFYDVEVTKGYVIEGDRNCYYQNPYFLLPQIVYGEITESAYNSGNYVFVPGALGLTVNENEEVNTTMLLLTSDDSYARNDMESSSDYEKQDTDQSGPFAVGVECEKTTGDTLSKAVIYSCKELFTSDADAMVAGTNLRLFTSTVGSFVDHSVSVSIPVKSYEISTLTISQNIILLLALFTTIVIPLLFLIGGFMIWLGRRKR